MKINNKNRILEKLKLSPIKSSIAHEVTNSIESQNKLAENSMKCRKAQEKRFVGGQDSSVIVTKHLLLSPPVSLYSKLKTDRSRSSATRLLPAHAPIPARICVSLDILKAHYFSDIRQRLSDSERAAAAALRFRPFQSCDWFFFN